MPSGATAAPMPLAPSPWSWPKSCGPGWPSELALTVKPRKSGIDALIWLALRFHQPRNASPFGIELLVGQRVRREPVVGRRRVVDRQRQPDPVRAQRVGQRRLLRDVRVRQVDVVGVDVVDRDAVDAERRQRPRHHDVAVEDHRQVARGAGAGRGEVEDRPVLAVQAAGARGVVAGVEALRLPVVEVAVLDLGRRPDVEARDRPLRLDQPQERERAVQGARSVLPAITVNRPTDRIT